MKRPSPLALPKPGALAGRAIQGLMSVQRPVVLANLDLLRRRHPDAGTAELAKVLERQFLVTVTVGGSAVGATAAIPAVGTGAALALSAGATAAFIEASALFAQSLSEIHGVAADDPERSRAILLALMLGTSGVDLVEQVTRQAFGTGPTQQVFWGRVVAEQLPKPTVKLVSRKLTSAATKRVAKQQATNTFGRILPFGIGAVLGGYGNNVLARRVIRSSRKAFG